jgi:hypothetical protein
MALGFVRATLAACVEAAGFTVPDDELAVVEPA